jgi:hypothetical protein
MPLAAEALLQPIRVPRQVVVDHQMGAALQVDALDISAHGHKWIFPLEYDDRTVTSGISQKMQPDCRCPADPFANLI